MNAKHSLLLQQADVANFARWSRDVNPLHVDGTFGAQTPFGGTIVHGMLSVLEALALADAPAVLGELDVEFRDAVHPGRSYLVAPHTGGDGVELEDAQGRVVLALRYAASAAHAVSPATAAASASVAPVVRAAPADRALDDLHAGFSVDGVYDIEPVAAPARALPGMQGRVLALCSYLVGMEIPGLRSLFTRLRVTFAAADAPGALHYHLQVRRVDTSFRVVDCTLDVRDAGGNALASAEIQSYFRFSPLLPDLAAITRGLAPVSASLDGKVALVCGGSRGLGASLTASLALAGCEVYASYTSDARSADTLSGLLADAPGRVHWLPGDAADADWCTDAVAQILAARGRLDCLVLNACTPPRPYSFAKSSADEFETYLTRNLPMVTQPLAAALPALHAAHGAVVTISSIYVEQPVPEFAPYVTLKQAVEGHVQAVAREHRDLHLHIVRPPRLRTSWNDTPTGVAGTLHPDQVAVAVVADLATADPALPVVRNSFPALPAATVAAAAADFTLVLAASFTAEPVLRGLDFWFEELGLHAATVIAPYGQVLQSLLNPHSDLARNSASMNVVLLRPCDWLREMRHGDAFDAAAAPAFIAATAAEHVEAFRVHRGHARSPTLLLLCPADDEPDAAISTALEAAEATLREGLRGVPGLRIVTASAAHALYAVDDGDIRDPLRNDIAHVPFQDDYFHLLATLVARALFAEKFPRRKVVVVDCDNTLWRGVVGEVGAAGVAFEAAHLALQARLREFVRQGVLVCLCSKNEEDDVWSVFAERPDFGLTRDDVVAAMINWLPKSGNLRQLAERLNLGIDSFVFIDDNPVECAEVRANCPEVLTLQWPQDEAQAHALLAHTWEFDSSEGTKEDAERTAMYREEFRRQSLKESAASFNDFIAGLELRIDIAQLGPADLKRAAQLTLRTNQFNLTTVRRNESEVAALAEAADWQVWTVKVSDRFGDYGLVGEMISRRDGAVLEIDSFLLSCRVLGRGVEHAMAAAMGDFARAQGLTEVHFLYRPSARNQPARSFLDAIRTDELSERADGMFATRFDAAALAEVRFAPTAAPADDIEDGATEAPAADATPTVAGPRRREAQIVRAAAALGTLRQLAAQIGDSGAAAVDAAPAVRSAGDDEAMERHVIEVFARALRLTPAQVRATDELAALGCDSFRIVEITVQLSEHYPQIPATLLFEHQRVSEICREIARICQGPGAAVGTAAGQRASRQDDAIAVVGIGLRCAGAHDAAELWELLASGASSVQPVPTTRAGFVGSLRDQRAHWAGLVDDVSEFDAEFFSVAPREAEYMDPQLRFVLEATWHALEDADGFGHGHLTDTGVFVGVMYGDYGNHANREDGSSKTYRCWESFSLANRVSQVLGFDGPSLAIDTACSSSATALHYACEALRAGDCRRALVAGVNLIIDPARFVQLGRLGILSPRGDCQPFGAEADGTVLGEGVGVVVLKPLAAALADGDRVYGVIKGTGVSVGAGSVGFTAPNPAAQAVAIRRSLRNAGCDPRTISYVETHGTGTALGDPIEVRGLTLAYTDATLWDSELTLTQRCAIGSIKPNIGHLEAGAGVLGLIKLLLQLHHGELLPSRTSAAPNPAIPFASLPFFVQRDRAPWPTPASRQGGHEISLPRRGALNSFGVGGSNVHVIVEEAAPVTPRPARADATPRSCHLLTLSARNEAALRALALRYAEHLEQRPQLDLLDVAHTANTRRQALDQRLAVVATDTADAARKLREFSAGKHPAGGSGRVPRAAPQVAFLFTGQGSQYLGMARGLWTAQPVFRASLEACARALEGLLEVPLLDVLFAAADDPKAALLDQTAYTQPAIFSLQVALAALWRSWGIVPAAVSGHSVGEIAALTVAGGLSLADGARLIACRGRLMQAQPAGGAMLSLACARDQAESLIAPHLQTVALAAINGPRQIVVSGAAAAIDDIAAAAAAAGVQATRLTVSHAFHSPLMDPMLAPFAAALADIDFRAPTIPLVSGVTGAPAGPEILTVDYWLAQVRQPVQFVAAVAALGELGISDFVEIGPHPVLVGLARASLGAAAAERGWAWSLRRGADELETLMAAAGNLYVRGAIPDWTAFDQPWPTQRVALPAYAFQHRPYWFTASAAPTAVPAAATGPTVYDIDWMAVDRTAPVPVPARGATSVFVLGEAEAAAALCDGLASSDLQVVSAGLNDTGDSAAVARAITALEQHLATTTVTCDILCLIPATPDPAHAAPTTLDDLDLWRRLAQLALARSSRPRLWLLTRAAAPLAGSDGEAWLRVAPLVAFLRGVGIEQPELGARWVDLPDDLDSRALAAIMQGELGRHDGEDQLAWRDARWYAPRLRLATPAPAAAPQLRADGVHVVTGATGAIGASAAHWLLRHGARHLVLVSRRGAAAPAAAPLVEALQAAGGEVLMLAADLGSAAGMAALDAAVKARGLPLRSVLHAAGVDEPRPVGELTRAALDSMLAPKAGAAFALHAWTADADLDLFVLFSSISATLGAPARAHYAAANACLDALAMYRRARGLLALSIEWGPWAGGGMADAEALAAWARAGNRGLAPDAALACLARLCTDAPAVALVADIDWPRFRAIYEARQQRPLLGALGVSESAHALPAASAAGADWLRVLTGLADEARVLRLRELLQAEVAAVLGHGAASDVASDRSIFELGMDSLVAVEFAQRVERRLGLDELDGVLEHPVIDDLAVFLDARLAVTAASPGTAATASADWATALQSAAPDTRSELAANLVRAAVAEVLGFTAGHDIPAHDNLFECGLDSLRAVELLNLLEQRCGLAEMPGLLHEPTVHAIAANLASAVAAGTAPSSATSPSPAAATDESAPAMTTTTELQDLLAFSREAWPERQAELVEPRWHWMFEGSAARLDTPPTWWHERVDGELAAFTGAIPVELELAGTRRRTGYLVDTMVLPRHRNRALGPRLLGRIMKAAPLWLSLGQSNEMREILKRLGWQDIGQLNVYALPLRATAVLREKVHPLLLTPAAWGLGVATALRRARVTLGRHKPDLRVIERFRAADDAALARAQAMHPVGVRRDASYLNWKYADQPGRRYVLLEAHRDGVTLGWLIYTVDEANEVYRYRRATLFELLVPSGDSSDIYLALEALCGRCQADDVDLLVFPLMSERIEPLLPAFGFLQREPHRYLMACPDALDAASRRLLMARANWLVTAGDSDIDRPL